MIRRVGPRALAVGVALATLLLPGAARAQSAATDRVVGTEQPGATSTQGTFDGVAAGQRPGLWTTTVHHQPLSPCAPAPAGCHPTVAITGGSFLLYTTSGGWLRRVAGVLCDTVATSGACPLADGAGITTTSPGPGCTDQTYSVIDTLRSGAMPPTPVGSVVVTLTHHRVAFLGRCLTYGATVRGTLSLAAP